MPKVAGPQVCSVNDCGRQVVAWGWCENHYRSWKKTGDPVARIRPVRSDTCEVPDCGRKRRCRGYCDTHWKRWRETGDPGSEPIAERSPRPDRCLIPDCGRVVKGRGWCKRHWLAWKNYGDPLTSYAQQEATALDRTCPGCGRTLPKSEFYRSSRNHSGVQTFCKDCDRDSNSAQRRAVRGAREADALVESVTRSVVFQAADWICGICHEQILEATRWPDPQSASLDHIVPLARGGVHAYSNVQAAHLGCNRRKWAKVPT